MRGKRAKALRKLATQICVEILKIKPGQDYGVYNQANNCRGWAPALDSKGNVIFGPDGMALKQLVNTLPGTVTCGYRHRVVYQTLKRRYKTSDKGGTVQRPGGDGAGVVQPT
jgi:hypothetical protein